MKRKFFTLLVAFLAVVGFQAKAVGPLSVGIQTGDSTSRTQAGTQSMIYDNERGGYASTVNVVNKLTFDQTKVSDTNSGFVYVKGNPSGATDKITVSNPAANFVSFSQGNNTLSLPYAGVNYDRFVVFKAAASPLFDAIAPNGRYVRVIDYLTTDNGRNYPGGGAPGQIVTPQGFDAGGNFTGNFDGFLGIQAGGYVDDAALLIVVHDQNGVLSLMTYKDYVATLGSNLLPKSASKQYYPLYVKTMVFSGRWATPSDFADCKFLQFSFTSGKVLSAYDKGATTGAYSTFAVKQVDYVQNQDVTNTHNIITHYDPTGSGNPTGANFQGLDADNGGSNSIYFGTTPISATSTASTDSVIPLFVLASPDNSCNVLSVSRNNDLTTQSQQDGGYANKLEVRGYGEYETYDSHGNVVWDVADQSTNTAADGYLFDRYTSLQKFAIWITADGQYQIYPAATYFWHYGEDKGANQPDNIFPNAVLIYNDINVNYVAGVSPADKAWGIQLGWWNGKNTSGSVNPYIATIPNVLQTYTDYSDITPLFDKTCKDTSNDLSGRYYFLQVNNPDTLGLGNITNTYYKDAFGKFGYQSTSQVNHNPGSAGREYVLATQIGSDGLKRLVMVPKEIVLPDTINGQGDYWRMPNDSVNMAAHWDVQPAGNGGYRLINMLGDTLKFNVTGSGTSLSCNNLVAGGYKMVNRLMAGMDTTLVGYPATTANPKYLFGRPTDNVGVWDNITTWFDMNPTASDATSQDVWNFHQYNSNSFLMELAGFNASIDLTPDQNPGGNSLRGWHKAVDNANYPGIAGGGIAMPGDLGSGPNGRTYFQQNINLAITSNDSLVTLAGPVSTCSGLMLSLQPITYVPTVGPFYSGDKTTSNGIYNTNDKNFQLQDSLDAYTFLEGTYDLQEANAVVNGLKLGAMTVSINANDTTTVDAARLIATTSENILQFIPVNSATGKARNAQILASGATNSALDTLYNETYKWYLVKDQVNGKYLTFDTVNVAATTNREKVGFAFSADSLANATPVRLYQPLVGDKENNNFLIQFYMPMNTYWHDATGWHAGATVFPDIENTSLGAQVPGGGEVCFATLSNQSNYIFGTRAYTGLTSGTRFTIIAKPSTPCPCIGDFIAPDWMATNRLLSLPLNNQIYVGTSPVNAWIATGLATSASNGQLTSEGSGNSAIIENDSVQASTSLTHTYVTSIKVFSNDPNYAKVGIPQTPGKTDYNSWLGGTPADNTPGTTYTMFTTPTTSVQTFNKDDSVALYYVQNAKGQYLTVVPTSDMQDTRATVQDVNGVKLQWLDKPYTFNKAEADSIGYDKRVFQLFAISGCEEQPVAGVYGNWVYLPLASYMVDYTQGTIVQTNAIKGTKQVNAISYNVNLGKAMTGANGCPGNDITSCYRVSQYTAVDKNVKDLVVFNSNSAVGVGNLVPIEFGVSKQGYIKANCDYQLVQEAGVGANKGLYYTYNSTADLASGNTSDALAAHWQITWDKTDTMMATFTPELTNVYGNQISDTASAPFRQTNLAGQYYFIKQLGGTIVDGVPGPDGVTLVALNISGYNTGNFVASYDTITLKCTDHTLPFYDLEADGGFDLTNKLAILETPFADRNLGSIVSDDASTPTPIYDATGKNVIGYRTYLNQVGACNFDSAEYLNVYKENRRELTSNHIIPYYSFSVVKGGNEYFLNVDNNDSVTWVSIDAAQHAMLMNPDNGVNKEMPNFKFCLPYVKKADGTLADNVCSKPQVYMQTLDTAINQSPYLIISYSATKYVSSRKLWDALSTTANTGLNIYSIDYRYIIPEQVTSWVFGGSQGNSQLWVPIADVIDKVGNTKDGVLTDYGLDGGGTNFITQSGANTPNYGILTGSNSNVNLTLLFEGDTTIGTPLRPIWYYRIQSNGQYMTDATTTTKNSYPYNGGTYYIAEFVDSLYATYAAYQKEGIMADQNFAQTFGFRYVSSDTSKDQEFYIVSNANYKTNLGDSTYRYLSQVNNHLVFISDKSSALVFQWGNVADGNYTDIQAVGQGNIFGVQGGVRFLNTTGTADIYSIDGRLIKSTVLTGTDQVVSAPRGIAIVKSGTKVVKVVVQ